MDLQQQHLGQTKTLKVESSKTLDALGNVGIYTGEIYVESGLPHGQGKMLYDAANSSIASYNGSWHFGKWHGQGVCTLQNGDSYDGNHVFGTRHGRGCYKWSDGRSYDGDFVQNERSGHGRYNWVNGSTYIGSFVKGQREGHGSYRQPYVRKGNDDSVPADIDFLMEYTGEWKQGKYHGYGVFQQYEKGKGIRMYRGHWEAGQKHGYGVETNPDGSVRYEGTWQQNNPLVVKDDFGTSSIANSAMAPTSQSQDVSLANSAAIAGSSGADTQVVNSQPIQDAAGYKGLYRGILHKGLPQGVGTMIYNDNTTGLKEYEGFWEMGKFHGFGRLCTHNGDNYEGNFIQGKRQGHGIYKWKDGRHYNGMWSNDLRSGEGTFLYPNNDMYEGTFHDGKRHGQGKFVFADGSVYEGEWKAGLYDGQGELVTADTGMVYRGAFKRGLYHGFGVELDPMGNVIYEGEWVRGRHASETTASNFNNSNGSLNANLTSITESSPRTSTQGVGATKPSIKDKFQPPPLDPSASNMGTMGKSPANDGGEDEPCQAVVDRVVWDGQGNKGRYTGIVTVTTQKPHGVGRLVYDDKNRIHEGFWVHGHRQGHGRCLFIQIGDFHEGEYHQNLRHGPGKYIWKDGRTFHGMYVQDERQGHGTFTYPNGDHYEGNFKKGQRHGFGRFQFLNGTCSYEGEWEGGLYHGTGTLVWTPRGKELPLLNDAEDLELNIYEGEFQSGVFHGKGREYNGQRELVREGIWQQGRFVREMPTDPPPPPPTQNSSDQPLIDDDTTSENDEGTDAPKPPAIANNSDKNDNDDKEGETLTADDLLPPITTLERATSEIPAPSNDFVGLPQTSLVRAMSAPVEECPTGKQKDYEDQRQEWRDSLDLLE